MFFMTFPYSLHVMFSYVSVCVLTYYFCFCRENGGGGGVMDLVYGSSSSLYMECEVKIVVIADSPI